MFIPKKSKYIHLPNHAYKGRKSLPYYACDEGKPAYYLLLEILNTMPKNGFTDQEIILFCEKHKANGLQIISIQKCLYKACTSGIYSQYEVVDRFIQIVITKWNVK